MKFKAVQIAILAWTLPLLVPSIRAERIYSLSSQLGGTFSLDSNPQLENFTLFPDGGRRLFTVFETYPSIELESSGRASRFKLGYDFGFSHVPSQSDLNSVSHGLTGALQADLSRRWTVRFFESFTRSPDFASFNLFRGEAADIDRIILDEETVALRRDTVSNRAAAEFDYLVRSHSTLSFGLSHYVRDYSGDDLGGGILSDQTRVTGNLRFSQLFRPSTGWRVSYSASQQQFKDFLDSRTHRLKFGVNHQATPHVSVSVDAGPSYLDVLGENRSMLGYDLSLDVAREGNEQMMIVFYHRRSGATSSVGSVSDVDRVGFRLQHRIDRQRSLDATISFFNAQGRVDNPADNRGFQASAILNWFFGRRWAFNLGGSFRTQQGLDLFDFDRMRVFAGIQLLLPQFMVFER